MGAVRDPKDRNNWKWLGGEDISVSFWNLPGGNEDCSRYDGTKGWLWSDTNCNSNLNYICQHQPKACGRPEQPPNSTMIAKNFNVGATIDYSCDDGHLLVGPGSRTCLPTGFYNEFPPVCKRIQCGYPADIPSGQYTLLNGSVSYMSTVLYSCQEGYQMVGRAQLTCDIDERWNGPPPRCEPVDCGEPPSIANGSYFMTSNNATTVGAEVEYLCSSRQLKLVGSKKLVCLSNGQYDKKPPTCIDESRPLVAVPKPPRLPVTNRPRVPLQTRPSTSGRPVEKKDRDNKVSDNSQSGSSPHIVITHPHPHPQDNEIADSVNVVNGAPPNANVIQSVEQDRKETAGARLNLGAIIALGVFGGFVFLAAIITTIVILIRRNRSAKHYRHRASPDCNTVASFDSSGSESRGGLNRYYRQAWENLHESSRGKPGHKGANHAPLRRNQTIDEPIGYRNEGMRDGSELVISDGATVFAPKPSAVAAAEKKRHHHHHHHHIGAKEGGADWRQGNAGRPKNRY